MGVPEGTRLRLRAWDCVPRYPLLCSVTKKSMGFRRGTHLRLPAHGLRPATPDSQRDRKDEWAFLRGHPLDTPRMGLRPRYPMLLSSESIADVYLVNLERLSTSARPFAPLRVTDSRRRPESME